MITHDHFWIQFRTWDGKGLHMRGSVSITHQGSQLRIEKSDLTVKIQGTACACGGWQGADRSQLWENQPSGEHHVSLWVALPPIQPWIFFLRCSGVFGRISSGVQYFSSLARHFPLQPSELSASPLWQSSPHAPASAACDIYSWEGKLVQLKLSLTQIFAPLAEEGSTEDLVGVVCPPP